MGRNTRIVCTIGPATSSYRAIRDMAELGMDVARLNFSHGTHKEHLKVIRMVRRASSSLGRRIAVLQDLPGPKIRVGELRNDVFVLKGNTEVVIRGGMQRSANSRIIPVPYKDIPKAVDRNSEIYLADGTMTLRVKSIHGNDIVCNVETGGDLRSHKGVNIPETTTSISAITEEDERHMLFGLRSGVDYIAASFVRSKEDIAHARRVMDDAGKSVPIIAKIEKKDGLKNCKEIVRESDGVMVARGDLGVEIGLYRVPIAQKLIIMEANRQKKPVITATQMLLSMVHSKVPTRAEVSDVANAILDGTDAVMLSEESAAGPNYREAVSALATVAHNVETSNMYWRSGPGWRP